MYFTSQELYYNHNRITNITDMSIDKRCVFVKDNNLCKICLSKGHMDSVCKSPYIFKINNCNKKHSSLLHMSDNRSSIAVTNNYYYPCHN